jgi:putative ABC transport system substrate-binding protein
LIVTASPTALVHRDLIISLAAKHRLPAVYPARFYVTGGGLISYGPDSIDQFHRAAGYVDRFLRATSLPIFRFRDPPSLSSDQPKDCQGA